MTASVVPAPEANAATVTIGTIQGQLANHVGVDYGTSGNCITYAPGSGTGSSPTSSGLVTNTGEAQTGHGRPGQGTNTCPSTLNTGTQSVVGFKPSSVTSIEDGTTFPIGQMVHYNNPVYANDRYYTGDLRAVLGGFTGPNTLTFPWTLDETPNTGSGNCCNDTIVFNSQISDITLTQGGLRYKLVVQGFVPVASAVTACPATPSGTPQNQFSTVEGAQTRACLYGQLVQERSLTLVKNVLGSPPGTPSFPFTSTSALAGSAWSNGSFSLGNGGTRSGPVVQGNTVSITEADPGDDRWSLTSLTCTQYAANGASQVAVAGVAYNTAARSVTLANIPAPLYPANPTITCTYTNAYTPKTTLTLVKQVQGGVVSPTLWTLTATGNAGATVGTVISGPSGSAAVTTQRITAGTYQLTELGTGAAETGFVQVGSWACTAGATSYPVSPQGVVTLPDLAAGTTVSCRVINRQATGSLQINKVVSAPDGGYTGGASKTFSGSYTCGTGFIGTFSTLTTANPVTIGGIPAGRSCSVTENAPTGGLQNASFAWGAPTTSTQPVTIPDQGTAAVTITNTVVQNVGTFSVTKVVDGPGGFTGGTTRVFPVSYACTLTNGPPTSGTLDVTLGQAVSPPTPIPTGSVCSLSETLSVQPGDFSDPSYVWSGSSIAPTSVTIGVGTNPSITVTNSYTRETGQLVIAKIVDGEGYIGTGEPFVVGYSCGVLSGQLTLAPGGSQTVTVPARNTCTAEELPPDGDLLDPGHVWGTPTWAPSNSGTVPANGSVTLTVTNPTVAVFGKVEVSKAISGETQGVTSAAQFAITVDCTNGYADTFTVPVGGTGLTPDLPVGTTCTVTEAAPSGGLIDDSYAWGTATIEPTSVVVAEPQQVVVATVTNPVVRVRGSLTISKELVDEDGVVDPARLFGIDYSCFYGSDAPVVGTVELAAGGSQTVDDLLLGSNCSVVEGSGTLAAPPSADDGSYVWLPPAYSPGSLVSVASSTTPAQVTVTNTVDQLEGTFRLTKSVTGAGKDGGYTPGDTFTFAVTCTDGPTVILDETPELADGDSWTPDTTVPVGTECTIAETAKPGAPSAYGWDPVQFSIDGVRSADPTVTFEIREPGAPIQVNAVNPITPRFGSVALTKAVTGESAGLAAGATFVVNLTCGPGLVYQLTLTDGATTTQDGIPSGSVCTAVEAPPDQSSLVDASYAWGAATYTPADATVTVGTDTTVGVVVNNPVQRVTASVRLVKTVVGGQGVLDPARTYPVTWSCFYGGTLIADGTVDATADPAGVLLSDDVLLTADCSATEDVDDLGAPSTDPAYRWLTPEVTGTTVTASGPNTVVVANALARDSGQVLVRKQVTGETQGYVNLGDPAAEDFTLHGSCAVSPDPTIPTRYADGTIADGGEVPIVASIGWTCSGTEDTPGQGLLVDTSYAWGEPVLTWGPASDTAPPAPTPENTGPFVLTRAEPTIAFWAVNPIVRVSDTFSITKTVVDPFGVVDPATTYSGGYSCRYGTDEPVTGVWTLANGGTFTGPSVFLNSVCAVTEDDQGTSGLPDGSYAWQPPQIGDPVTVVSGGTATVVVTNTVERLYAGLRITKTVDDPDGGLLSGSEFGGAWSCALGDQTYAGRFVVEADGSVTVFTTADARVPATAVCSVTEDTLDPALLVDGSFGWDQPAYDPEQVDLTAGETADLGITNTVHRVYSAVAVQKVVSGPAAPLVPSTRAFTGVLVCQYADDDPVLSTWQAGVGTPWVQDGILVGSVCSVTENAPGATGQPVDGDPSYGWLPAEIGSAVTVTPPTEANPVITVTNPTERVFGQFFISKAVSGATGGIVDRATPYPMTYSCQPGTGGPLTGEISVAEGETVTVGPGQDIEVDIPIASVCTLTEPLDTMPALVDSAWSWGTPTFTVEGLFGEPLPVGSSCADPVITPCRGERSVTVTIPPPQEDQQEPTVGLAITNPVQRSYGSYTVEKTSDPASGSVVLPGQRITYTLTVTSTGTVPVHDVEVTDDLTGVAAHAAFDPGSVVVSPAGSTPTPTPGDDGPLVWAVGTVPPGGTRTLSYAFVVDPGAVDVTIGNSVTSSGDVPPEQCAEPGDATDVAAAAAVACSTTHTTPELPTIVKEPDGEPTWDAESGAWRVGYRLVVDNPNEDAAVPYTLTDQLDFPEGVQILASSVQAPDGVILADPAWDGTTRTTVAAGVQLPAGASHTYRVSVLADVPTTLPTAALTCADAPATLGSGFFNSASLAALGVGASTENCQAIPVVLVVDKVWEIDGVEYPEGSQPDGYSATLWLDDADAVWGGVYAGYAAGSSVDIGEQVIYPASCTVSMNGIGTVDLAQALTSVTVTNVVTCDSPPPPTTPTGPTIPTAPTTPGTLPDTGFPLAPFLSWGLALLLAGGLLLGGLGLRNNRNRQH